MVLSTLTFVIVILLIVKAVIKLSTKWNGSYVSLLGKTVIVTGANTGIGYYTALDFAKRGAKVILGCRNRDKAEIAKEKIITATENPNIFVEIIDFASLESIEKFAQNIIANEEKLHILVNNAGALLYENTTTVDGLSSSMQVNYFGPFLLTSLLLDLLKTSAPSRIVNLSSCVVYWSKVNLDNLNYFSTSFCAQAFHLNYGASKLCVVLWTNELARKLRGSGVTTNSVHPGCMFTEIFRDSHIIVKLLYRILEFVLFKTWEEGAQTTIYASISKDVTNISGEYFDNCQIGWMPKCARDVNSAKKLWEHTEQIVLKRRASIKLFS